MSNQTYAQRLGQQLRQRRRSLRLNQTEVAELAGTTQRSVSQAETGKASRLQLYGDIAEVLGLEVVLQGRGAGGAQERGGTGGGA